MDVLYKQWQHCSWYSWYISHAKICMWRSHGRCSSNGQARPKIGLFRGGSVSDSSSALVSVTLLLLRLLLAGVLVLPRKQFSYCQMHSWNLMLP